MSRACNTPIAIVPSTYRRRTRHIDVGMLWIQEQVEDGSIGISKVKGEDNPADVLTKNLQQRKLFELTSSIYFHSFTVLFFSMFATLLEFQKEGQIFAKEYQSNMYGTFVYYISKLVIEMPILIVMPLVETLAIFWVIGYNEEAFWQFYFCDQCCIPL